MTEEDTAYLRALYAGLAMNGIVTRGINADIVEQVAKNSVLMADALLQQLDPKEEGIAKARRKKIG
jgi:uncharacterized protein related to proFAR isomerase